MMLLQRQFQILTRLTSTIKRSYLLPRRFMIYFPVDDNSYGLDAKKQKLRESAFRFFQKELAPHAQEIDKNDFYKDIRSLWKKMGSLNFHGITAEPEYGGIGGSYLDHCIIMEEMSRAAGGLALSYGSHSNLCINQISKNGTDKQKEKFLPQLCSGEKIGGVAVSEFGSFRDLIPQLKAKKARERFILNGNKSGVTNGENADILIVFAKTGGNKNSNTAFIVERNPYGITNGKKVEKAGMRGSNTCELIFQDLAIPEENVLGFIDDGAKVLTNGLDLEKLILAAGPVGLMQAACDLSFDYAHQRKKNNPLEGEIQLIQGRLTDMYSILNPCRSYLYSVARAVDRGRKNSADCSGVLLYCAEKATKVAMNALQIMGRKGYENDKCAERILRDARLYEIAAESADIRPWMIEGQSSLEYA